MNNLIAKHYVKALTQSFNESELKEIQGILCILANVWNVAKFKDIMESPCISREKKVSFILQDVLEGKFFSGFENFLKVLVLHDRLNIFGELYDELSSQVASKNKEYLAYFMVNEKYEEAVLKEIESKFSKKLGVNLLVKQEIVEKPGVKLVVEDLGIEVSFSQDRFINDLKSYILKAF